MVLAERFRPSLWTIDIDLRSRKAASAIWPIQTASRSHYDMGRKQGEGSVTAALKDRSKMCFCSLPESALAIYMAAASGTDTKPSESPRAPDPRKRVLFTQRSSSRYLYANLKSAFLRFILHIASQQIKN